MTIRHGPLPALNMMPMTVAYSVRGQNQRANLQPMQKVEFRIIYDGTDYLMINVK